MTSTSTASASERTSTRAAVGAAWVAYVVVRWNLGLWPKCGAIVLASFALSIGLYELVVRRTNATRFLFGLKPLPRPSAPRGR